MVSYTSELWRSAADARRECDTAALRSVFQDKSKDYQSLLMIANRTTDFKILPYDLPFDRTHTIYVVFQFPRVWRCPAGIGRRCQVISGFGHHLGLTDTLGLDLMLVSIRCQTRWIKLSRVEGSPSYPSYPWQATFSYTSLQKLTNRNWFPGGQLVGFFHVTIARIVWLIC